MPSSALPDLGSTHVTVIGGGAASAMLLMQWQRQLCWPGRVVWCEAQPPFAQGAAYRTTHPRHLLNVPAGRMGCYAHLPEDFLHWAEQSEAPDAAAARAETTTPLAAQYLPRRLYGTYLQERLQAALASLPAGALHHHPHRIAQINPAPNGGYIMQSEAGKWHSAHLVLAMGNQPQSRWDAAVQQSPQWLGHGWAPIATNKTLDTAKPLLIIGAGLTAMDAVFSLRDAGWQGEIMLASRNGHLPQPHLQAGVTPYKHEYAQLEHLRPAALARYLRALVRAGIPWRDVVDGLRPLTILLWQNWSAQDQARFLKRLWPWWNIHRHRHAPQAGEWLDAALSEQFRQPLAASVQQIEATPEGLRAHLRGRGPLLPAAILDCTGPSLSVLSNPGPLSELLADGLLVPAANGAGLQTYSQHAAYTGSHGTILALGTLTLGMRLETTAIPELRQQVAEAASYPLA
jgi:uncharacterized NAD(P)/FAD-binding protein YdhS